MKKLVWVMVFLLIFTAMPVGMISSTLNVEAASDTTWQDDFYYNIDNNNIVIQGYKGLATNLYVPDTAVMYGAVYTVKLSNSSSLFFGNTSLKSVSFSRDINTSNVIDMSYMFSGCTSLESIDISGFDTSNVTNMECMFQGCSNLQSLNLSNFDTSKVTDIGRMFRNCYELESIDVSSFDTRNMTEIADVFFACASLTKLDLGNWDLRNIQSYENYGQEGDLCYCDSLTEIQTPVNLNATTGHRPVVFCIISLHFTL